MIATRRIVLAVAALSALAAAAPARAQQEAGASAAPGGNRVEALSYVIVDGVSAPDPLTDTPGDAERGRAVFFDAELGGCAACHWVPGVEAEAESLPGPRLDDVGARYASGRIRLWIVNPRALAADPPMPAYFSLTEERERRPGDAPERLSPVLTPQEIEDLIAYLEGMSAPPQSATPRE